MKSSYLFPVLLCGLCMAGPHTVAQKTTNSPMSMSGVGELCSADGGRYAGLGNVGLAVNRVGFQNTLNPAAITRMDSTCFVFDVGASASFSRYSFCGALQQRGLRHSDAGRDRRHAGQLHLLAV